MITLERLKELLEYDPETGIFLWIGKSNTKTIIGTVAGTTDVNGYVRVQIDRVKYLLHRLAWLYTHGAWPSEFIDHINGIRNDNRISNLREANSTQNNRNAKLNSRNASGYKGVGYIRKLKKYAARIYIKGKCIYIGFFDTPLEASKAYEAAAITHFKEFARLGQVKTLTVG